MAQVTLYLQSNGNYNAANAWNTAANGSGTAYTNPQNNTPAGTTYLLDLNGYGCSCGSSAGQPVVDQIQTGSVNAGGYLSAPSATISAGNGGLIIESTAIQALLPISSASQPTVVNANIVSNSTVANGGVALVQSTGVLTINGNLTNNCSSAAIYVSTGSTSITINGQATNSGAGQIFRQGISATARHSFVLNNPTGVALQNTGSGVGLAWTQALGGYQINGAVVGANTGNTASGGSYFAITQSTGAGTISGALLTSATSGGALYQTGGTLVINSTLNTLAFAAAAVAAQLASDQAAVTAASSAISLGVTILSVAGGLNVAALQTASYNAGNSIGFSDGTAAGSYAQFTIDQVTVGSAAPELLDWITLLGEQGSYVPANPTLYVAGNSYGPSGTLVGTFSTAAVAAAAASAALATVTLPSASAVLNSVTEYGYPGNTAAGTYNTLAPYNAGTAAGSYAQFATDQAAVGSIAPELLNTITVLGDTGSYVPPDPTKYLAGHTFGPSAAPIAGDLTITLPPAGSVTTDQIEWGYPGNTLGPGTVATAAIALAAATAASTAATSAQLSSDRASLTAAAMLSGYTALGTLVGTYNTLAPYNAGTAAGSYAQFATDQAAVGSIAPELLNTITLLGETGSYVPPDPTKYLAGHTFGPSAAPIAGSVTLPAAGAVEIGASFGPSLSLVGIYNPLAAATWPTVSAVLVNAGTWGPTGVEYVGSLDPLPVSIAGIAAACATGVADIYCTAFKNGTATFLARVVGPNAAPIGPDDVASVIYSVFLLDDDDPNRRTAVAGHAGVSLSPGEIVFAALQTDALWTRDAVGYNFRHTPDVSESPVFALAGRSYLVEYVLAATAAAGQPLLARFRVAVI